MVLKHMMAHEWRLLRADRTVSALLAITVLLTAYGLWNGQSWVSFQKRTIAMAMEEQDARLEGVKKKINGLSRSHAPFDPNYFRDPRNPRAVNSVYGFQWATLPPAPLAALAVGQSDLYPYYAAVTAASRHTSVQFEELQNPVQLLAGRFDLAFVIVYLLPLLVFSLSYNLLSEERENGTLSMVLAQPVKLSTLLLAKASVRALLVLGLSLFVSAGGLLAGPGALSWTRTVLAYALFWLGVAVVVNALGFNSATNALALAGVWLVLVAVVPSILNVIVSAVHPLPSRIGLVEAAREAQNRALVRISDRASTHGSIDMDLRARSSLIQIMEAEAEVQPILQRFDQQLEKQQQRVRQWRMLSPAIVAQLALTEIAGTSGSRYRKFVSDTEAFRSRWRAFLSPLYGRQFTAADVDRIPRFSFAEPECSQATAAWFLLAGSAGCGMFAWWRTARHVRYLS